MSVHVKVAPDADAVVAFYRSVYDFNSSFEVWVRSGLCRFRVEEGLSRLWSEKPAADESLLEEDRQVEGRKRRNVNVGGIKPASHFLIVAEIGGNNNQELPVYFLES